MAQLTDIHKGACLLYKGTIYQVVDFLHVKPGKGPAFVNTKLKNLVTGNSLSLTIHPGDAIEMVRVERRTWQYLYSSGDAYHFMDQQSHEFYTLPADRVPQAELLKAGEEGIEASLQAATNEVLSISLPATVVLRVTSTEEGYRGDTVNKAMKPAILETGYRIKVPIFIKEGEQIKVSTKDGSYQARAGE